AFSLMRSVSWAGNVVEKRIFPPLSPKGRGECTQLAHLLSRVTLERMFFKLSCSSTARTTRKPTKSALVSHQMLCGRCGSSLIQLLSEPRRLALRHLSALSAQLPPRATCEKRSAVGSTTGCSVSLSDGKAA